MLYEMERLRSASIERECDTCVLPIEARKFNHPWCKSSVIFSCLSFVFVVFLWMFSISLCTHVVWTLQCGSWGTEDSISRHHSMYKDYRDLHVRSSDASIWVYLDHSWGPDYCSTRHQEDKDSKHIQCQAFGDGLDLEFARIWTSSSLLMSIMKIHLIRQC